MAMESRGLMASTVSFGHWIRGAATSVHWGHT